jgi:hypothetical protein
MQIDESAEHSEKTADSSRRSLHGFSKMTSLRDLHRKKDSEQRTSTKFGTQIDDSDRQ